MVSWKVVEEENHFKKDILSVVERQNKSGSEK